MGLAAEDDPLARVGALQTVSWEVLKSEEEWLALREEEDEECDTQMVDDDGTGGGRGMMVQVKYEKAIYTAILLRAKSEEFGGHAEEQKEQKEQKEQDGFQRYPLLLTRMPASLRDTFTQFLATTFDVRVSGLKPAGSYLTTAFEQYIREAGTEEEEEEEEEEEITAEPAINARTLRRVIKDVQFTIAFDIPGGSSALKTIDIMIDREDVPRMVVQGKQMGTHESPFLEALRVYVKKHLALDMNHEGVHISKIACGAYVLGDGRLKLIQPPSLESVDQGQRAASQNLIDGLVELALGGQLLKAREMALT